MSAKDLAVLPLPPEDREAWEALVARHGCIFDSLRWTDLWGPSVLRLGLYDAGRTLRGGFCVAQQFKFGLRILRNPPYTPHIGPFFEPRASNPAARTDEQRAVVEAMAGYLSSCGAAVVSLGLSQGITDCLPFYWRSWKVIPHYTYRLDLAQDEDALLAGMATQQRNPIKKARKDGVCADETPDTGELRSLVVKTFARQDKAFAQRAMDGLLAGYPPGSGSYCLVSRLQGVPLAGVYVVNDSRTAYNMMAGYDDGRAHNGAGPLALWQAILKAKQMGLEVFDFEGSAIPAVERYYRGFGGRLTPYLTVHKAWLPVELLLKCVKRRLF